MIRSPLTPLSRVGRSLGSLALTMLATGCTDGPTTPGAEAYADEPAPEPQPAVVAFVGVDVVPMDADAVLADQTVVVRDGVIESVGARSSVTVPSAAFRIEGRGRFLVPGLIDMHVHLTSQTLSNLRNDFVLFLANGVTTVRVMWGSLGLLAERDRIEAGEVLGPTLLMASPGLDAPGGTWTSSTPPVTSPSDARQRVTAHERDGYDFIKVYNDLDVATYDAILEEATGLGIPVVGHVPWRVGIERVQDAGQLTLEHFIGFKHAAASAFNGGTLDMTRVRALAARSAERGVWHTPTLTVDALSRERAAEIQASEELQYVSPGMRSFFETGFHHGLPADVARREDVNHRAMIAAVADAGGGLLVGTDAGFGWILPGYSIHEELSGFRKAGLPPFAALAAATSAAAESVDRSHELGTIAPGLGADLLLVVGNPLRDIEALRELSGVMVRGRWLSRGTLAHMLETIRTSYGAGGAPP